MNSIFYLSLFFITKLSSSTSEAALPAGHIFLMSPTNPNKGIYRILAVKYPRPIETSRVNYAKFDPLEEKDLQIKYTCFDPKKLKNFDEIRAAGTDGIKLLQALRKTEGFVSEHRGESLGIHSVNIDPIITEGESVVTLDEGECCFKRVDQKEFAWSLLMNTYSDETRNVKYFLTMRKYFVFKSSGFDSFISYKDVKLVGATGSSRYKIIDVFGSLGKLSEKVKMGHDSHDSNGLTIGELRDATKVWAPKLVHDEE